MRAWGLTDQGMVRKTNQDCFSVRALHEGQLLAVVCDGMGGQNAGDVASTIAMDVFTKVVEGAAAREMTEKQTKDMLLQGAMLANRAVLEESLTSPDFAGMGTTLVAAFVQNDDAVVLNVGDSRAYFMDEAHGEQITKDHSLVAMMLESGKLTPVEAERFPAKNMITRAVGTEETVQCDVFSHVFPEGSCLLLCSDGLSNMVTDQEMQFEVMHGVEIETCCWRLVRIARDRGAPDNVTAVVVSAT